MYSFKIGDEVEILHYDEDKHDAPSGCIGNIGIIIGISNSYGNHTHNVFFEKEILGDNHWFFKPEQLKQI